MITYHVSDTIEIKGKGLAVILDARLDDLKSYIGRLAVVSPLPENQDSPSITVLILDIIQVRDHGTVSSLLFSGLKKEDIPIGSSLYFHS